MGFCFPRTVELTASQCCSKHAVVTHKIDCWAFWVLLVIYGVTFILTMTIVLSDVLADPVERIGVFSILYVASLVTMILSRVRVLLRKTDSKRLGAFIILVLLMLVCEVFVLSLALGANSSVEPTYVDIWLLVGGASVTSGLIALVAYEEPPSPSQLPGVVPRLAWTDQPFVLAIVVTLFRAMKWLLFIMFTSSIDNVALFIPQLYFSPFDAILPSVHGVVRRISEEPATGGII